VKLPVEERVLGISEDKIPNLRVLLGGRLKREGEEGDMVK